MTEPEIHHLGHPRRAQVTCCGIPMPPEQVQVRTRDEVRICAECARRFKRLRAPGATPDASSDQR